MEDEVGIWAGVRGLLERKAGAEPGTPSEVVVWWVLGRCWLNTLAFLLVCALKCASL